MDRTADLRDYNSPPLINADAGVIDLYRNVWRYAEGARHKLVASTVLLTTSQLIKLTVPWMAAQAINSLQQGGAGLSRAAMWIPAIILIYVAVWALHGPGRVLERAVGVQVRRSLSDTLYARLAQVPMAWHDRHHSGDIQHRVGQSTAALSGFAETQFIYLQNAVNLVGPLVALTLLSGLTGGLALAGYVTVATVIIAFDRVLMKLARQENDADRRYAAGLLDYLSNISTVVSLRLQASTRRLLGKRLERVFAPLTRSIVITEWKWCAVDLITITLTWCLVGAYAWHSHSLTGALLLGNLFMVYQYASEAGGVIGSLAANFQSFARVRTDFSSADVIMTAPQCPNASATPIAAADTSWQRIDLCGIGFQHGEAFDDGAERGGLKNVSFSMHRGERIALVGPSGSGKSTLLRVIAGQYEARHGHVEVDGVAPLGMRHAGRYATLIPQESQVFEASVRENIAFDLPLDTAMIKQAMSVSAFDTVLADMPQGLDTPITEGGFNLSGGQRQRLCLARGVLAARESTLLLLDEPTSALDQVIEAKVYGALDEAFPDACIVASVHRLSLLSHFDKVVLMAHGQVVDVGRVDELIARQALFREMLGQDEGTATAPAIHLATANGAPPHTQVV